MTNVVVITGASRGIGKACALEAAKKDFAICINYKSQEESANSLVDEISEMGGTAIAVQADIAKEAEVDHLFQTVDREYGQVSVLINNAGILAPICDFESLSADRINSILTTNITGSFLCAREAVKRMSKKHGGHGGAIVNVSSSAARLGSPHEFIDYAASKGAIDTMTIGLSKEVAEYGIRVNAVRPGLIDTDMQDATGNLSRLEDYKNSIPLKRWGKAMEVAKTIMWLASDEASYINGALIDVSGGR